ncbi:hypothetical protein J2T15_006133 [Paenibacillus harenae]|uniref:Endoglucanase B carbohydrate binding domain-containing protein n=1 Tax=Paenibacillus harenae TaxID=306543 RepID=A0ABT9UCE8_PAEHA|nr:hypothetical protein [Paenibacillus harenae]
MVDLTTEFFNEVNDGEVMLKLHFWSRAVFDYRLSVSGSKVTGTPLADEADGQEQSEGADDSVQSVEEVSASDDETSKQAEQNRIYESFGRRADHGFAR